MKKGSKGKKQWAMDMEEQKSRNARNMVLALPNAACMVVIHCVSNVNNYFISPIQLIVCDTAMRPWEKLIDLMNINGGQTELHIQTYMVKCTLEWDESDDENTGLYTHADIMKDPIRGQISYNCLLSNAYKLRFLHDWKICLGGRTIATGKEIAM